MDNYRLLNKYAINYLSRYDSTKKNLEKYLKKKIIKFKNLDKSKKINLFETINQIIQNLESKNIINDKNFANNKIISLFQQGKSEYFIKNILFKKGIDKELMNEILKEYKKNNPEWEINSAKTFARKKNLGKQGTNNKEKDLAKMARAGFDYNICKKILGVD